MFRTGRRCAPLSSRSRISTYRTFTRRRTAPITREDIFNPVMAPDLINDFRVNAPPTFPNIRMDPRTDAVLFNFGEIRSALPPAPHAEAFAQRTTNFTPSHPRRSSPVDGAGPRAQELEAGLQALEAPASTPEFKNAELTLMSA
ncbi:unnamed protein product [Arctia plantaginis]|uniref:Uncharacterized protein n=1 Tax=Arctia plantaginis TaxID=874455 RepID=A0A8S1ATN4_ARCPL|nr:unnamed protein product [Arctia plantaginis]